jgi:hypothetical protein
MAINTFCSTLCATLVTLAAAPALAFDLPAGPATAAEPHITTIATTTTGEAYRNTLASRQPAAHMVLDATPFAGTLTTEPLPATGGGNDVTAQFWQMGAGAMALRPYGPDESQSVPLPETGNLPLLGAAAVALLVAQLRRSRRPAVR